MTSVAQFRFYAELNDFVSPHSRQRDFPYRFLVSPSVKDVIEALGVPHTEVDLILANGEPVDFGYRLAAGDRISVYPVFEALDISATNRLRPEPLRQVRFIADTHLGTLAHYLRLLGFDTRYDNDCSDDVLARLSVTEGRMLLTRDRGLLKRRAVTHGHFIRHDDPRDQVVDVARRLDLADRFRPFTRCMACNGVLEAVDKAAVVDRLEPRIRRDHDEFRRCPDCGRVYWQGSHHTRLVALVEDVRHRTT
jgi:uncharacterized protein